MILRFRSQTTGEGMVLGYKPEDYTETKISGCLRAYKKVLQGVQGCYIGSLMLLNS